MRKALSVFMVAMVMLMQSCWEVSPAFATDVQIGKGGIYRTLAANTAWSAANQVWIITPVNQNESVCLYLTNFNPSSSHTFTLSVKQTGDPYVSNYSSNTAEWVPSVVNGSASPLAASSSVQVSASISGAAQFAVIVSGATSAAGSPDTFNLLAIQGAPCASPDTWDINSEPGLGVQATVSLAGIAGVRHVATVIAATMVQTGSTATNDFLVIRDGACGSGTVIFDVRFSVTATGGDQKNIYLSGMNVVGSAGNAICIEFGAGHTGVIENVNLLGFDTQ